MLLCNYLVDVFVTATAMHDIVVELHGEPNYAWADQLTREQAAALFYRFAKLMGKA